MRRMPFGLLSLVLLMWASTLMAQATPDAIRIVIVGDSTVRDYDPQKTAMRGWGQLLPTYLKSPPVTVINLAIGGRSSKSFITEGRWNKMLQMSPSPDYVLIQFGHNDIPNKGPERETRPEEIPATLPAEGLGSQPMDWYRHNIRTFIEQTRSIGAVPIVVTPMERRSFKSNGPVRRKNESWAQGAAAVAKEINAPLIDLNAYATALYDRLGLDGTLFMHYQPPEGEIDNTHYNEVGARIFAEYIAQQLSQVAPALQPYIALPATSALDQAATVKSPAGE